jgi:hypothetical protein
MSCLKSRHFWQVSILVTTLVCLLLAVGCTSSIPAPGFPAANASLTQTLSSLPATGNLTPPQTAAQCPQETNTSLILIRGDPFSYKGTIPSGNPSEVRVWVFGQNSSAVSTVPVQQGQAFLFNLTGEQSSVIPAGTYQILFEIPHSGTSYNLKMVSVGRQNDTYLYDSQGIRILDFRDITDNQISGPAAADAVEQAIQKTGTETVTSIYLTVKDPEIAFDPMPDYVLGDNITISGTTNLHPGEVLDLQIVEGYLHPCAKCSEIFNDSVYACCGYGVLRQVPVMPGMCGINIWSVDVDTSRHDFATERAYEVFVYGWNGSAFNASTFTLAAVQGTQAGS